jgi:hypothetical protein
MKSPRPLPPRALARMSVAELQFALVQRAQAARCEAIARARQTLRVLEKKFHRGAAELSRLRTQIEAERADRKSKIQNRKSKIG